MRITRGNLVSIIFGLCLAAAGLYLYAQIDGALEHAREARSVVADLVYESGTKKGRIHPVVRFRAEDGREVLAQTDKHYNVQPGETVSIVYDVRNPLEVEIGTLARARQRRSVFALLTIAIGVASVLAGLAMQLGLIRRRRTRPGPDAST